MKPISEQATIWRALKWISALCTAALLFACGGGGGGGGGASPGPGGPGSPGGLPVIPQDGTPVSTAKGADAGAVFTLTLSTAGGQYDSPDGKLRVAVPAGAVEQDTVISVQPTENLMVGAQGLSYKFSPSLSSLKSTVTVSMVTSLDAWQAGVGSALENFNIGYQDSQGQWYGASSPQVTLTAIPLRSTDDTTTEELTPTWVIVTDQIPPRSATQALEQDPYESLGVWTTATLDPIYSVVQKGGKRIFALRGANTQCEPKPEDPPPPPPGQFEPLKPLRACWGVKDVPELSAAAGEFKELQKNIFEFTAPNEIPVPNPVDLNVLFSNVNGKNAVMLFAARVKVTDRTIVYEGDFHYRLDYAGLEDKFTTERPYSINIRGPVFFYYAQGILGNGYELEHGHATVEGYTIRKDFKMSGTSSVCRYSGGADDFINRVQETSRAFQFDGKETPDFGISDGSDKTRYLVSFAPSRFYDKTQRVTCSIPKRNGGYETTTKDENLPDFLVATYAEIGFTRQFPNPGGDDRVVSGTASQSLGERVRVTASWNLRRVAPDTQ
jgi:hypothetical protein